MSKASCIKKISDILNITKEISEKFYTASFNSGEFKNPSECESWLKHRLKENTILLNKSDYEEMCLSSLKVLKNFPGTDFGSSRQRDFNQKWADTTRGYLGERAFQKFLLQKFKIKSKLKHTSGERKDYDKTDIDRIKRTGESKFKPPRKTIGIKTTKFNGMWLDIPGNQFEHYDYHVMVKLMLEVDHIFSFFKEISIFKDKLLKRAVEKGYFKKQEADTFFSEIPDLKKTPAYITGFVESKKFQFNKYEYIGKKGPIHYTITSWKGKYKKAFLEKIKNKYHVEGEVKFQSISKFSHQDAYIFNTGCLDWSKDNWKIFFDSL